MAKLRMTAFTPIKVAECLDRRLKLILNGAVIRELSYFSSLINHTRREWGINMINSIPLVNKPPSPQGRNKIYKSTSQAENKCHFRYLKRIIVNNCINPIWSYRTRYPNHQCLAAYISLPTDTTNYRLYLITTSNPAHKATLITFSFQEPRLNAPRLYLRLLPNLSYQLMQRYQENHLNDWQNLVYEDLSRALIYQSLELLFAGSRIQID